MKILIADDHALFRDGLSFHLERLEPQAVIFQAGSFSQVMKIINDENKLDLIIALVQSVQGGCVAYKTQPFNEVPVRQAL